MKKAIRTAVSLMSLCIIVLALSGCGSKDNSILDNEKQAVWQSMMSFAADLEDYRGLSESQLEQYISSIESYKKNNQITEEKAKMNEEVITEWHEIEGELGSFKGFSDFDFDSAGKTYTATLTINYSNRDVHLVYVISKADFEITGANVEIVYTLGEKMSKAGINTLLGIGIVFVMLVLMSVVIYAFNLIPYLRSKFSSNKQEEKKIEISHFEGEEDRTVSEPVSDDKELIAVIAAAIAASTGASTDDFVVRSIRRRR